MNSSYESQLSQFFSGRNHIRWDDLASNRVSESWSVEVSGWLYVLEEGGESAPVCLPCLAADGSVQWYAGSRTVQGANAVASELHAFVGPSYTDFGGHPKELDTSDPQESALKGLFVDPVFLIEASAGEAVANLSQALSLFRTLVTRRPPTLKPKTRPFGVVRGLFDRALLAGNEKDARALLSEMRRSGRLNAANLMFLNVRLLAGLGLWDQIVLESNLLWDLTDFALPPSVVRDVSEAFYRFYVQPFESKGELEACLNGLRSSSLVRLDRLFTRRHNIQHPAVIKVFLLRELLRDPVDIVYTKALFGSLREQDDSPLIREVSDLLKNLRRPSELDESDLRKEADRAYEDVDYDRALALYLQVPAELISVRRMVACARLAADENSAKLVLDFLAAEKHIELDEGTKGAIEALEKQAQPVPTPPRSLGSDGPDPARSGSGWLSWASWVANGATQHEALTTLHENAAGWPVEPLCSDSEKMDKFAGFLGNASGDSEKTFRFAFDEIFSKFLLDLENPPPSLKSLYRSFLFLLAASESLSKNDLSLTTQLTSSLLAIGLSLTEYEELVDILVDLVENHGAITSLDWALDLAEALVLERCQNKEARLRFFTIVSLLAQQSAHRIVQSQRQALENLHRDFSIAFPDVLKEPNESEALETEAPVSGRLAGKKIAIYTLTVPAGQRAAATLKDLAPDSEIVLNSDHDCSERLSALAKSADIFVFAWRSSKHQAYYCVKDHRPDDLPTLQPLGKGSASIIREVLDFV